MKSLAEALLGFCRTDSFWRLFLGFLAGLFVSAALWIGLWMASIGLPLTFGDRAIIAWYQIKNDAAYHASGSGRKILIAGGSNALYGVDAAEIAKEMGMPTVNFGTHAALNLDYLLWRTTKALRSGDVLVLSLEWDHFLRAPFEMNQVSGPYLLAAEPKYVRNLPLPQIVEMLMSSGLDRILLSLRLSENESERIQRLYNESVAARDLDPLGDIVRNRPEDKGPAERAAIDRLVLDPNLVLNAKLSLEDPVWQRMGSFIKACRKKHIAVWIAFPSLMDAPFYRDQSAANVYRAMEKNFESLGAQILTRQEDSLYPKDDFFDSLYHLQSDARHARTALIISQLKQHGVIATPADKP